MKISVIIPIYNVGDYICRCLDSLFRQTYHDFEIILVDDCGNDDSILRAKQHIEDTRWSGAVQFIYHEKNLGPSASRNDGIQTAKGKYVFFIDGDDTISPDCFEKLIENADRENVDYVMAKLDYVYPSGEIDKNVCRFQKSIITRRDDLVVLYRKKLILWSAVNKLIRRTFITDNKIFFDSTVMAEDLLWNFVSLFYIQKVLLLDEHTYQYYRGRIGSSTSSAKSGVASMAQDMLQVMNTCETYINKAASFSHIIKYYLELRYDYIPYNIFWHNYNENTKRRILQKIFAGRVKRYYWMLPIGKKILFLFPFSYIYRYHKFKFYCSELKYIIKNHFKRMVKQSKTCNIINY